jgi:hypothetical protein
MTRGIIKKRRREREKKMKNTKIKRKRAIELLDEKIELLKKAKEKIQKEISREEDCTTCIFGLAEHEDECPVPFEVSGQLSSVGYLYCPFWIGVNEE